MKKMRNSGTEPGLGKVGAGVRAPSPNSKKTAALRRLLKKKGFLYMPVAYDALGGRLLQSLGFDCVYTGGFVTGASRCTSEPLLTMDEQLRVAGDVANAIDIPLVVDGGAGFGEPLHTMRTVRECIRAGLAGAHLEDQLYPKRAHYHKYVAHAVPRKEFAAKIDYACRQRDRSDPDFVVIARTDTCRSEGLKEAVARINLAADAGADMGLIFPRNADEMKKAPRQARIPLVYVISRGNRDGRPLPTAPQLADMGYKAAIDAMTYLLASFHFAKRAYQEIKRTGGYTGLSTDECVAARHEIETLVGLDAFYEIEEETVEKK
jgi:methylisocitrate lyase